MALGVDTKNFRPLLPYTNIPSLFGLLVKTLKPIWYLTISIWDMFLTLNKQIESSTLPYWITTGIALPCRLVPKTPNLNPKNQYNSPNNPKFSNCREVNSPYPLQRQSSNPKLSQLRSPIRSTLNPRKKLSWICTKNTDPVCRGTKDYPLGITLITTQFKSSTKGGHNGQNSSPSTMQKTLSTVLSSRTTKIP